MILSEKYTRPAIVLHWLVAVLMLANLALGWLANDAPDAAIRPIVDTHKSIGITVAGLFVLRLLWRLTHRPPPLLPTRRWERLAAHTAHIALYALVLALPLTGWLHDSAWKQAPTTPLRLFWLIPIPRLNALMTLPPAPKEAFHTQLFQLHAYLGYALAALVTLHIAAALKHQFIDHAPELQRMV